MASLEGRIAILRAQLKVAPVTASIMMLTVSPGSPVWTLVVDRVAEIMLGVDVRRAI